MFNRVMTRCTTCFCAAVGVLLLTVPTGSSRQALNPLVAGPLSAATAADLARLVAQSGFSAGFIVTLPEEDEETLAQVAQTRGQLMNRSAFGLWLKSELGKTDWGTQRLASLTEVDEALAQFRARRVGAWQVPAIGERDVRVLKAKGATLCATRLTRLVRGPVESRDLIAAISTLVREATAASVPRGFVGSCIGANQFATQPITLAAGATLEATLNNAVGAFRSSVWIAVEGRRGVCSVGVIQKSLNEGVCTTAITDNIPQQ